MPESSQESRPSKTKPPTSKSSKRPLPWFVRKSIPVYLHRRIAFSSRHGPGLYLGRERKTGVAFERLPTFVRIGLTGTVLITSPTVSASSGMKTVATAKILSNFSIISSLGWDLPPVRLLLSGMGRLATKPNSFRTPLLRWGSPSYPCQGTAPISIRLRDSGNGCGKM